MAFKITYYNVRKALKKDIMTRSERVIFSALSLLGLFLIVRYFFWWIKPEHIPTNWQGKTYGSLHLIDILLFGLLTFIVFINPIQRLAAWFALWFAREPVYMPPEKGLRVAFLTCFVPGKEPVSMLADTLRAMLTVDYPHDTWLLDEGNDPAVQELCQRLGVHYFSRSGNPDFNQEKGMFRAKTKAGNLNAWRHNYEHNYHIVAQIDMDHVPTKNYFLRTLGYFHDPKVGYVVVPQIYGNEENWIARGANQRTHFFYGPLLQGFYGCDMPFLIGTTHIYRTQAMQHIGGYLATIAEDHLTGLSFHSSGWKSVYVKEALAVGQGPLNWVEYFNQQKRWSYGLFEILFRHTPRHILKLKPMQKIHYFLSQLFYFSGVAFFFASLLTLLYLFFGITDANMQIPQWVIYALPPFVITYVIQIYTHKFHLDPDNEPVFGFLGVLLGIGANLIYALAFFEFLLGRKLQYAVTAKGNAVYPRRVSPKVFTFHMLILVLTLGAFFIGLRNHHTSLIILFWALTTIVLLAVVIFSNYASDLRRWLKCKRLQLLLALPVLKVKSFTWLGI